MNGPSAVAYACTLAIILGLLPVVAQQSSIDVPDHDSYIQDLAQLVEAADVRAINAVCGELRSQRDIPLYVVTTGSMAEIGIDEPSIESYAWSLFEQWGADPSFAARDNWRQGILFLVSKGDRKARIELGLDWNPEHTQRSLEIMDRVIVPAFKAGNYSSGILEGVHALAEIDRVELVSAPVIDGTSPMVVFVWGSILMLSGFALLYGLLVFVASKLTRGGPQFPPVHAPYSMGPASGSVDSTDPTGLDAYDFDRRHKFGFSPSHTQSSDTHYDSSSTSYDSGSSSIDSGGGFSDGGGATGSW